MKKVDIAAWLFIIFTVLLLLFGWIKAHAGGQHVIPSYNAASRIFWNQLHKDIGGISLYCGVSFDPEGFYMISPNKKRMTIEHVLPAQWMAEWLRCKNRGCTHPSFKLAEADLHNLWPALGAINSSRGQRPFGEVMGGVTKLPESIAKYLTCDYKRVLGKDGLVEPRDGVKGDIARSLLYMNREYRFPLGGMWPTLLVWGLQDPPDVNERWRNDIIETLQGTRNIFIDKQ